MIANVFMVFYDNGKISQEYTLAKLTFLPPVGERTKGSLVDGAAVDLLSIRNTGPPSHSQRGGGGNGMELVEAQGVCMS